MPVLLMRCRTFKALLLRNRYRYQAKTSWNEKSLGYLRSLTLTHPGQRAVPEATLHSLSEAEARIGRREESMGALLADG